MTRRLPLLVLAAALGLPGVVRAGPRPLSEIERQAVSLAGDYLHRGPVGIWDRLSRHSPLRALSREGALAEIETRCGPPAGARWELATVVPSLKDRTAVFAVEMPSGLDDTLVIDFVEEAGEPKVHALTSFAERSRHTLPDAFPAATPPVASVLDRPDEPKRLTILAATASAGAGVALVLAFAFRRRPILAVCLATGGTAILALGVASLRWPYSVPGLLPARQETVSVPRSAMARLGALLPLRRALASGEGIEEALRVPPPPEAKTVAALWHAQWAIQSRDLGRARQLLDALPRTDDVPLAEVLRGRIAFLESKEADAALAYERAISTGPGQDALWYEAAAAFAVLGFDQRSRTYLDRLARMGTRNADVWYVLARRGLFDRQLAEAKTALATAWDLRPVTRADLAGQPIPWELFRDPELNDRLRLEAPAEPVVLPSAPLAPRPIPLPPGADVHVLSSWLSVTLAGGSELVVPGGAPLAAEGTAPGDAVTFERAEVERALSDLPRLTTAANRAGALALPGFRRAVERAASAAARRNRWAELVRLTDGVAASVDQVPVSLLSLRVEALRRTARESEAKALAVSYARSAATARRNDPGALYRLAEILVGYEELDLAISLVARVQARLGQPVGSDLVRHAHLEQRLRSGFEVVATPRFRVLYPTRGDEASARRVAEILEAERDRLQAWIPGTATGTTTVHLLEWDEFRQTVAPGPDVLGLYDGRIRVPLAGVSRFTPGIVALLTHELAHALVADATRQQAPRWLHEGLAQHVEMTAGRSNPMSYYSSSGRYLSLPVVEGVLDGMADPELVLASYETSCWVVHFVEKRFGPRAIPSLLAAYAQGLPTEEAVPRALGVTTDALDSDFRSWVSREAPPIWRNRVVRYDTPDDPAAPRLRRAVAGDPDAPRKPVVIPESLRRGRIRWNR